MTHCEKCIYYDKCKADMGVAPDDTFSFFPYNEDCKLFKNKADFVEVVRCHECKSYNGHRYCEYFASTVFDNDFCSYGERKDA